MYSHHAIGVGLSHHDGLAFQDVWSSSGGDAVLEAPGAVGPVGKQERVQGVWLQTADQLLGLLPIHLHRLAFSVQDLKTEKVGMFFFSKKYSILFLQMRYQYFSGIPLISFRCLIP